MLFFLHQGYRVIAHDRRGHGRSSQTSDGHDMDHYADDLAALTAHLDLNDAVHVGHSTGGGEVVHYIARHGEGRVAKAVLISSVPPLTVKQTQPRRPAQQHVRRSAGPAGCQPVRVLSGLTVGTLLRLQPAQGRAHGGDHRELVEAGDDGRSEGTLRRHRRLLPDRFHRGPQKNRRPCS